MAKKWWLLRSKQLHPLLKSVFSGMMSGYLAPIHRHTCWPCQHFGAVYWNRNCRLALVLDDEKIINLYEIDIREIKLEFPIHSLQSPWFCSPLPPSVLFSDTKWHYYLKFLSVSVCSFFPSSFVMPNGSNALSWRKSIIRDETGVQEHCKCTQKAGTLAGPFYQIMPA